MTAVAQPSSPIQDEFLFDCYSMHLLLSIILLKSLSTKIFIFLYLSNEVFASEGGIGKIIDYISKLAVSQFFLHFGDYIAHFMELINSCAKFGFPIHNRHKDIFDDITIK
ncbi:hypothetical protein ACJX0J_022057 [Zea mays]